MLTAKQEEFAKAIVEGKSQADAYRAAYSAKKMSNSAIYREASLLMSNPNIAQRVQELRDQIADDSIMTARERLELLTRMARGEEPEKIVQFVEGERIEYEIPASLKTRREAIDVMNKMTGEYTTKIAGTVNTSVDKLEGILAQLKK